MRKVMVITGCNGLIGSTAVRYFAAQGWDIVGIDNNMRAALFGSEASTDPVGEVLAAEVESFVPHNLDIRNREAVISLIAEVKPTAVVHCAAQPSHEMGAIRPFDDFDINAVGTLNVLEAVRQVSTEVPFVYLSTNKVYGDTPNTFELIETETRYTYADPDCMGVNEDCSIDTSTHSFMGVSKLAGDLAVQEYGRLHGMPTVCFRAGCLTGAAHAGTEMHGFLAHLIRSAMTGRTYRVFGYKGKQVRDNLHAFDVCTAIDAFLTRPKLAAVYNLGGGQKNSISVLEALQRCEDIVGTKPSYEYVEQNRRGDHICYISDTRRFQTDYPQWQVSWSLDDIFTEMSQSALVGAAALR